MTIITIRIYHRKDDKIIFVIDITPLSFILRYEKFMFFFSRTLSDNNTLCISISKSLDKCICHMLDADGWHSHYYGFASYRVDRSLYKQCDSLLQSHDEACHTRICDSHTIIFSYLFDKKWYDTSIRS
jgi:hypothetical protein